MQNVIMPFAHVKRVLLVMVTHVPRSTTVTTPVPPMPIASTKMEMVYPTVNATPITLEMELHAKKSTFTKTHVTVPMYARLMENASIAEVARSASVFTGLLGMVSIVTQSNSICVTINVTISPNVTSKVFASVNLDTAEMVIHARKMRNQLRRRQLQLKHLQRNQLRVSQVYQVYPKHCVPTWIVFIEHFQ